MSTLRDKALRLFAKARTELVDQKAGLRRYRVFVRVRTPSDARGGLGTTWVTQDTELTEKPRLRKLVHEEVRGVGRVPAGSWIMDRVTPLSEDTLIGTPYEAIDFPQTTPGAQVRIVLVGEGMPPYIDGAAGPPITYPYGGGEFVVLQGQVGTFGNEYVLVPVAGKQGAQ
jgi:hypothetical protein